MFKKANLRLLGIVLIVLSLIVIYLKLKDNKQGSGSYTKYIDQFDTAKIEVITLLPKDRSLGTVTLERMDGIWKVKNSGYTYNADLWSVEAILYELHQLRPERVATKNRENWKDFGVDDSTAVIVDIKMGKREKSRIYIGRFSYQQPTQPYQGQGKMTTYVRYGGSDNVYAVEGFLQLSFNKNSYDFISKVILPAENHTWVKLTFTYPDSSFVLAKGGNIWRVDGTLADTVKVHQYLEGITNLRGSVIVMDSMLNKNQPPAFKLTITGRDEKELLQVKAYALDSTDYLIGSTYNEGVQFQDNNARICNKLFIGINGLK